MHLSGLACLFWLSDVVGDAQPHRDCYCAIDCVVLTLSTAAGRHCRQGHAAGACVGPDAQRHTQGADVRASQRAARGRVEPYAAGAASAGERHGCGGAHAG